MPKFKFDSKESIIICHNLPPQSPVEGLLGLNFLKQAKVIIDFPKNIIEVPEDYF